MNPNAGEWVPSASAGTFVPGQGLVPSAPAPAPVPAPSSTGSSDDALDESDPLWQAVLKIAQGDRAKAQRMLEDPDQLAMYPEIESLLAGDTPMAEEEPALEDQLQEQLTLTEPEVTEAVDETPDADMGHVKEGDPRDHLNLVFIGHVDAGKST